MSWSIENEYPSWDNFLTLSLWYTQTVTYLFRKHSKCWALWWSFANSINPCNVKTILAKSS